MIFKFQTALLQRWIFPGILCKIAPFASTLSVNLSIITLVVLSIDRFYVILYPLKAKLQTNQCFAIIIFIWLISLALSSLHLYSYEINNYDGVVVCLPTRFYKLFEMHSVFLVFAQYIVPFIIIAAAYTAIIFNIYLKKKEVSLHRNQQHNKKKVVKMLLIVIVLFMICWAPIQLYNLLSIFIPEINE